MLRQWITARRSGAAGWRGCVLLPFALVAMPAAAQPDPDMPAEYGSLELVPGQALEPYTMMIVAGGTEDAMLVGDGCLGLINLAPDVSLYFGAGGSRLVIGAYSEADTTIVINGPDGRWHCNDDYAGLNPGVAFDDPAAGRYNIWIGAFEGSPGAELVLTERDLEGVAPSPDYTLPPIHGTLTLSAGFAPDPNVTNVVAGGPADPSKMSPSCSGGVPEAPTLDLIYTGVNGSPLVIGARSEGDTTIVVNAPDGQWYCNDDFVDLDPSVVFDNPQDGLYDIWVGSFFDEVDAELMISTAVPESLEIAPDLSLQPLYGDARLEAGFTPTPHVTSVVAGGPAAAWLASPECYGNVSVEPTLDLYYTPARGVSLTIGAHSAIDDTTILINAPDGSWYCNDDFNDLDPAVVFDTPAEGLYDIWVGAFFGAPEAALLISEGGGNGNASRIFGRGSGSDDDSGSQGDSGSGERGSSLFGGDSGSQDADSDRQRR